MGDEDLPTRAELAEEIEDLRERNKRTAMQIREAVQPLREAKQTAENERDRLEQRVGDLERTVAELEDELDAIVGLAPNQETSHQSRVGDIRVILKRRAEARRRRGGEGKATMDRLDIDDALEEHGHGSGFADAQLLRIIDDVADEPGYSVTDSYTNRNDNEVKAARVNLDQLAVPTAANDVSSSEQAVTDGGSKTSGGDGNSG